MCRVGGVCTQPGLSGTILSAGSERFRTRLVVHVALGFFRQSLWLGQNGPPPVCNQCQCQCHLPHRRTGPGPSPLGPRTCHHGVHSGHRHCAIAPAYSEGFLAHVLNTLSGYIQALYTKREGSRAARCPAVRSQEANRTQPTNPVKQRNPTLYPPQTACKSCEQTHYTHVILLLQFCSNLTSFEAIAPRLRRPILTPTTQSVSHSPYSSIPSCKHPATFCTSQHDDLHAFVL
jgi:hypothetical protein